MRGGYEGRADPLYGGPCTTRTSPPPLEHPPLPPSSRIMPPPPPVVRENRVAPTRCGRVPSDTGRKKRTTPPPLTVRTDFSRPPDVCVSAAVRRNCSVLSLPIECFSSPRLLSPARPTTAPSPPPVVPRLIGVFRVIVKKKEKRNFENKIF